MKALVGKSSEIDAATLHQILLDRADAVVVALEIVQAGDLAAQPPGGTLKQETLQFAPVTCREQIAKRPLWSVEHAILHKLSPTVRGRL